MAVPVLTLLAEIVDVDKRHACFDKPASHEQILSPHISSNPALRPRPSRSTGWVKRINAVALAGLLALFGEVDRLADGCRLQELLSLIVELPQPLRTNGFAIAGLARFQLVQQMTSLRDPLAGRRFYSPSRKLAAVDLFGGVANDSQRIVGGSQESGALTGGLHDIVKHK